MQRVMPNRDLYKDKRFPHCDERVLHAPGQCIYCDDCQLAQLDRLENNVCFTGEDNPSKTPCPSDVERGLAGAHHWYGNTPKTKADLDQRTLLFASLALIND
jgi:hypothetical protein